MRWFRHTIAEFRCGRCAQGHTVIHVDLSPFLLLLAVACALPLGVVLLRAPWDLAWYHVFGILAGEVLLLYASGFFSSLVLGFFDLPGTGTCRKCGASMISMGRHYDPKGSARPHRQDFVLWVVFLGLNVTIWLAFLRD